MHLRKGFRPSQDQEDYEAGRGRQDDLRGGARPVREGVRDVHPRADNEGVGPHRGQQEEDLAEKRHRHGHHQVRPVRLLDRHRAPGRHRTLYSQERGLERADGARSGQLLLPAGSAAPAVSAEQQQRGTAATTATAAAAVGGAAAGAGPERSADHHSQPAAAAVTTSGDTAAASTDEPKQHGAAAARRYPDRAADYWPQRRDPADPHPPERAAALPDPVPDDRRHQPAHRHPDRPHPGPGPARHPDPAHTASLHSAGVATRPIPSPDLDKDMNDNNYLNVVHTVW